jgi:Ca2+-dependent lipid-binding protein
MSKNSHNTSTSTTTTITTTNNNKTMRVELSLHASKLKNVAGAFRGTSDPFAVVTKIASAPGQKPEVIGKTEVIQNTLSPHWVKSFEFDYELGTPVKIAVNIFDEEKKGDNIPMGSTTFMLEEILGTLSSASLLLKAQGGTTPQLVHFSNTLSSCMYYIVF